MALPIVVLPMNGNNVGYGGSEKVGMKVWRKIIEIDWGKREVVVGVGVGVGVGKNGKKKVKRKMGKEKRKNEKKIGEMGVVMGMKERRWERKSKKKEEENGL